MLPISATCFVFTQQLLVCNNRWEKWEASSFLSQKEKENVVESTAQNRIGHSDCTYGKDCADKYRHLVKQCRNQIPRDASQPVK